MIDVIQFFGKLRELGELLKKIKIPQFSVSIKNETCTHTVKTKKRDKSGMIYYEIKHKRTHLIIQIGLMVEDTIKTFPMLFLSTTLSKELLKRVYIIDSLPHCKSKDTNNNDHMFILEDAVNTEFFNEETTSEWKEQILIDIFDAIDAAIRMCEKGN